MALFKYEGPLYRQGRKVESRVVMYTNASSIKEARSNFIYRAGKGYDILYNCISLAENSWEEEHPDRVCSDCGNLLMDNGQCPLCDNSDYCIMDDIKLLKDVDDGNYTEY